MSVRFRHPDRHVRGFTLVELMVVVAIIAVVSAFAVPSYLRYGLRTRRVDAHHALLNIAMAQERYYATHGRYTKSMADLGLKTLSEKGYYRLSLEGDEKDTWFHASAAPAPGGAQAKDVCRAVDINSLGQRNSRNYQVECAW